MWRDPSKHCSELSQPRAESARPFHLHPSASSLMGATSANLNKVSTFYKGRCAGGDLHLRVYLHFDHLAGSESNPASGIVTWLQLGSMRGVVNVVQKAPRDDTAHLFWDGALHACQRGSQLSFRLRLLAPVHARSSTQEAQKPLVVRGLLQSPT